MPPNALHCVAMMALSPATAAWQRALLSTQEPYQCRLPQFGAARWMGRYSVAQLLHCPTDFTAQGPA